MSGLEIIQIPMLIDNYGYLLIDNDTKETAMIDPSEARPVLEILAKRQLKLHTILNTHHHPDHTGGNKELKKHTDCKVLCSSVEKSKIPEATGKLNDRDIFKLGKTDIHVIELPGHTIGAIAFYIPSEQAVFSGDTLFSLGCGRLFEGTPEEMWNSLRRLADLPRTTKVYCGHEYTEANGRFALSIDPHNDALKSYYSHVLDLRKDRLHTVPSTIEIEVEANPFLRAPQLIEKLGLSPDASPAMAFAEMRRRKDHFTS